MMRRWPPCLLCLPLLSVFLLGPQCWAQTRPTPEATLRAWAEAFKTHKVAAMAAFYEDSEHVVAWESIGKVRQGIAAIRSLYEDAFAEVRFETVAMSSLDVRQSGDVAWATCRFKAETILRADGSRWTLDIRGSFVLKQEPDGWKIVLEHFSPIEGIPRVQRRE